MVGALSVGIVPIPQHTDRCVQLNKNQMELNKQLAKASKKYAKNVALRSLVNLIPTIGSSLDVIFTEKWNRIVAKRIESFFKYTQQEFEKIQEEKVNKEFIESEDFADLVVNCLSMSSKTRQKEKIKMFSNILKNASIVEKFDYEEFIEIIHIVEVISVREFYVLKHLEEWEDNLQNDYRKMLGYSEKRKITVPNTNLGIPIYFSFWDAFISETADKLETSKKNVEYIIQTSAQKGLFVFKQYNVSKNGILSARETFKHTMDGKLTELYFKMIKYIKE